MFFGVSMALTCAAGHEEQGNAIDLFTDLGITHFLWKKAKFNGQQHILLVTLLQTAEIS